MARRAIGPLTILVVAALALPGGVSALNETHGAWTVACAIGTQDVTVCSAATSVAER